MRAHAAYTSPEGLNFFGNPDEHPVTAASDLWNVGCLVLELLVGQPVFVERHEVAEPRQQLSQKVLQRHTYWVRCCLLPCLLCCSCSGILLCMHFACLLPCPVNKGCTVPHVDNIHCSPSHGVNSVPACRKARVACSIV